MITFIRSIFNSKIGLIGSFIFIALVAIAFAGGDITGNQHFGSFAAGGGDKIAKVGKDNITSAEVSERVKTQLDIERRQNPGIDMLSYVNAGGFEQTVDQIINSRALEQFATTAGLAISKRLVDGEIASIPAFFGLNGKYDRTTFLNVLNERRLTEQQVRSDIASDLLTRQLIVPIAGAARASLAMAKPYAALSLEARAGLVGFVPTSAMAQGAAPTEAELTAYYTRNIARYTVPERRVIRYAMFGKAMLAEKAKPSETELQDAYKSGAANYAASETRTLTQVILQDQNAARAFETKVKSGTSFAAAAAQAGLEPATLTDQDRAKFTDLSSKTVADAVFATSQGQISAPQRSGLGWHVVRVDAVKVIPARSFAQVRGEIEAVVAKQKLDEALADLAAKIEDEIADGKNFDEVAKAHGLQITTTPALAANGADPENPAFQADPNFAKFIAPMFQATVDDDPAVETIVPNMQFALADLERIIPATPSPLAKVRDRVNQEFTVDRALQQVKAVADAIVAKTSKGMTLAQAISQSGIALPKPEVVSGRRMDLTRDGQRVPPPVALLFSMAEKNAKRLEAPQKQGWYIVYLDKITPGDVSTQPQILAEVQRQFGGIIGQEYAAQFAAAAKTQLGVTRNDKAIATVKRQLSGTDSAAQ